MPTGTPKGATRHQVAMYGHIAAALRRVMKERGWKSGADLAEAMGKPRTFTNVYQWVGGRGAPSAAARAELSKATGLPESALMVRVVGASQPPAPVALATIHAPPPARPVLVFSVLEDATMEIEMRKVRLPLEEGAAFMRLLLDAGVVFRKAQPP